MEFAGMVERSWPEMVNDAAREPRLMIGESPYTARIEGPEDVAKAWPELPTAEREVFGVLMMNTRNTPTHRAIVSVGSINASIVHPREVYRIAILHRAAHIIVVHNHPSGDPEPSEEDLRITRRLTRAGELLGVELLDHVIIGRDGILSLRSRNAL